MQTTDRKEAVLLTLCLAGIALSLVLAGVASGTIVRHVAQIVPLAAAGVLVIGRSPPAPYLVVGLCAFWAVMTGLIWLYLLGLSGAAAGTYSLAEILLTFAIALFSVAGILRGTRAASQVPSQAIAALIAAAFVIQAVVTSVSIRFLD